MIKPGITGVERPKAPHTFRDVWAVVSQHYFNRVRGSIGNAIPIERFDEMNSRVDDLGEAVLSCEYALKEVRLVVRFPSTGVVKEYQFNDAQYAEGKAGVNVPRDIYSELEGLNEVANGAVSEEVRRAREEIARQTVKTRQGIENARLRNHGFADQQRMGLERTRKIIEY